MRYFLLFSLVYACLINTGCATPQMRKWEGNKFTLCCQQFACGQETWRESVAQYCTGKAYQIGGETVEKVTGYRLNSDSSIQSNSQHVSQSVSAEKENEECRIYECSGQINQ